LQRRTVERLAKQPGDYHSQALGLSDRQKLEASECYRLLEGRDASLFDAVHHYLTYVEQTKRSIPVSELFDEFLSAKQQDNVSPKYLADLRSKLGRFVNSFHDTLVCNVTVAEIEGWIRGLVLAQIRAQSMISQQEPQLDWRQTRQTYTRRSFRNEMRWFDNIG
jgi:hypothetical protein